ncbi:SixA phosphatase family protein [Sphingobacterium rhinopitheci]|uniref:SixA phosphatase family protein n=1 Tax=Sphingobacterium rhinopitheci TaxID=2781960 RepID=UPI001F51EFBB|nr:histidine phosphatase family protein [Sphingobacterium rhinopitheci]MCI0920714.1 histidine phosphatase family protein [Sphingobacterium rhinopitheci]
MIVKKLFIIRHGKAEEHAFSQADYDRNLIEKGINRSKTIANQLKEQICIDDNTCFISSSANRAIQTANLFAEILKFPVDRIIQNKAIYEAYYQDILTVINKVPQHIDTVFVFGHNPGLSDLTNYICNSYITLKTSAVAKIHIEEGLDFTMLSGGTAYLQKVISE